MRLLLTNDDGIYAPGICALYDALIEEHEVIVVAPEAERSAVGHAITLSDPLRVKKIKAGRQFLGFAINGTPADCVKIAIHELIGRDIDMVISGINRGANVGINVLYSGTVSAATEGAILGYKALAFSLNSYKDPDFCFASNFASQFINSLKDMDINGICLNINIPDLPPHKIRGIKITRQNIRPFIEKFEKRVDPHGNVYYWQTGEIIREDEPEDVDTRALREGYISITPIHHDLTYYPAFSKMKYWNINIDDFSLA